MKFRGAQKLTTLWCFIILYVQILSGFKNWDIQDLTLRRYDAIKTCPWNFFKFFWVVHYRKICKNQILKHGTTMVFSGSQKTKNITKVEQKRLFLFTFLIWFFMVLHSKYIFNFVFGSFFEQDHLLNFFNLGVYAETWPKYAGISKQKLWGPFHRTAFD